MLLFKSIATNDPLNSPSCVTSVPRCSVVHICEPCYAKTPTPKPATPAPPSQLQPRNPETPEPKHLQDSSISPSPAVPHNRGVVHTEWGPGFRACDGRCAAGLLFHCLLAAAQKDIMWDRAQMRGQQRGGECVDIGAAVLC
jgi:hypothetical protein